MRVRYTPRALGDLSEIYSYLDERSPSGEFPFIAPVTDIAEIYELTLLRYPYKIYYRVEGDEIWVLHVRHTARQAWQNER